MKKNLIIIILIGFFCFTLLGCSNKYQNDIISLNIKENTLTNSKVTLNLVNNTNKSYEYGDPYKIEYKKDNIWNKMTPINDMDFNMIAYIIKPNKINEITINWEYHYGKLNPGKYRIVKNIYHEGEKDIYINAEFEIK